MAVGTGNAAYRMTEGLVFDYAGETVDAQHLNVCGAEKGTRHFGSHLKEQYVCRIIEGRRRTPPWPAERRIIWTVGRKTQHNRLGDPPIKELPKAFFRRDSVPRETAIP